MESSLPCIAFPELYGACPRRIFLSRIVRAQTMECGRLELD
jgi:hypothetical protein